MRYAICSLVFFAICFFTLLFLISRIKLPKEAKHRYKDTSKSTRESKSSKEFNDYLDKLLDEG